MNNLGYRCTRIRRYWQVMWSVLALPAVAHADCIAPGPSNSWKWGLGGGAAWMQFGNHLKGKPIFTLKRSPDQEAVQLIINVPRSALAKQQEVPGFMPFSFEGGFNVGRGNDILATDGVGILQELTVGGVALFTGNLYYENSNELALLRDVSRKIKGVFRAYADDYCYEIPLPARAHRVMNTLLAPHRQFSEEAAKLFLK